MPKVTKPLEIPKGILPVSYPLANGEEGLKYRVRIRRKSGSYDRYFDKLSHAKAFKANPEAFLASEAEANPPTPPERDTAGNRRRNHLKNQHYDPKLKNLFQSYLEEKAYLKDSNDFLARNRHNSLKSFLNVIATTRVAYLPTYKKLEDFLVRDDKGREILGRLPHEYFGEFNASQVGAIQMDSYIKTRKLDGKARATILKELSILKKVFSRINKLSPFAAGLDRNPADLYDRELLDPRTFPKKDKPRRIASAQLATIEAYLKSQKHPEVFYVFKLALLTGLRRAEVLLLERDQIKDTYLDLVYTKTGAPRRVFLLPAAKDLLAEIQDKQFNQDGPRLFTLTFTNLQKIWQRLQQAHPEVALINFHVLRKEAISQNIMNLVGQANLPPLFLAQFFGASNAEKFAAEYIDPLKEPDLSHQAGVLQSNGHKSPNTTNNHYLDIRNPD